MFSEEGQSLLEVVIAVAVGIFVVAALTFATIFSLRNASFAKNSAQATKLAQEGMERVRTGRDRDECINGLDSNVNSWNGSNTNCSGSGSIWDYQITGTGSCDDPSGGKCYFKVDPGGALTLTNGGYGRTTFPTTSAEGIPSTNPVFRRAVTLSDNPTQVTSWQVQKIVTVIVQWTDFAGPHESKLTTILRKL